MAVYAALLSLTRSLHQILNLEKYIDPDLHKGKIVSLHEKVCFTLIFLEDYSDKLYSVVGDEIRRAAYEAQDFIDSYLCSISANIDEWSSSEKMALDQDLNMAIERVDFIWEEVMKMKNSDGADDILRSRTHSSPVDDSSTVQLTVGEMVVGFDDDLKSIKDYTMDHFDVCAWITVSAEHNKREIFSGLLRSFKKPPTHHNEQSDVSTAQLEKIVYQNLTGRRYLIVIDDIWTTKAWDDLKKIFPNDDNGSRILLTTRLSDIAVYAGYSSTLIHQMKFLNEDQSWELLQKRIFGQGSCPPQLVGIGKKIARNCGGLPLTIVVVAGLLQSPGNMTEEELWENISENISSKESTIEMQCSKILCLSYDRLPLRLKPCFLYIAAFPEDSQIDVSKLIKLWVAEGFLKPTDRSKCLEDVGERYLGDLVNRSLLLVSKKGPDGKLEIVGIHDMLRDICITKAEEEMFFCHVSSQRNALNAFSENRHRRLGIHSTHNSQEWLIPDSSIRSVLFFTEMRIKSSLSISCRRLSILDAPETTWPNFSDAISMFVNLRYIAFALNDISCPHGFPASISKLPNLQTLIGNRTEHGFIESLLKVPYEVWTMPKLRHLIMNVPFDLLYPSNVGFLPESGLETLEKVSNFKFTEEAVKILVNLKKLKVVFYFESDNVDDFNVDYLFRLKKLEELEVFASDLPDPSMTWNYKFPINLRKLTLLEVPFPWENMNIIGSLPKLEVLQMMNIKVFEYSEWLPVEGQFLQLKYFSSSLDGLVKWEAEKEHFPCLESLSLECAWDMKEIPSGIGEIDSLQFIELKYCKESLVDSARRIQEEQHENGNYAFQLRVIV
ncbi:putative late blight resistance protein homolog R1B-23 [Primulina huaijiensis]|uniref:putative late blight resistance protein homolog R1B-23 n=1 Tax=Primulina huaijiensis TaxID=1492673 RepID=UPI003CC73124